jgi:hypothetical protein
LKIQLLKKREQFYEIFHGSVSLFLKESNPQDSRADCSYRVNDRLNIIYPCNVNRDQLKELVSEFKYHKSFYRHILQTLYVYLAVRAPFEKFLSPEKIAVSVPKKDFGNWIFIPGNHSIRIIDIGTNSSRVFLKTGFNPDFIHSDAKTRMSYPWLLSPEVIEMGNGWFHERRVVGLPLDRLSNKSIADKKFVQATQQLSKLYDDSSKSLSVVNYANQVCEEIFSLLKTELSSLSQVRKSFISTFVVNLRAILFENSGSEYVTIVRTHGDFQPGNILCSEEKIWIIDWEYSCSRSIFYDALVFDLKCRAPLRLSERLDTALETLNDKTGYLSWTGDTLDAENRHYFLIFFIEDMLLRIKEVAAAPIYDKGKVLESYLDEIVNINIVIERRRLLGFFS